jgi:DNA repair protein RadC
VGDFRGHFSPEPACHPPTAPMPLKDLPPESRPRERLLALGPGALADAELIALLLRTGFKGMPVLAFAQHLLETLGGLPGLLNASLNDLKRVKGLGPAKRAEISAVMELARRSLSQQIRTQPVFDSPGAVKQYVQMQLAHRRHEVFCVLFMDNQQQLIAWRELFRGTLNQASVYPREVAVTALELHAASVILVHNHPSGVAEPSAADQHLTQALRSALALLDVRVLDHLIVGQGQVMSFAERGLL